MTREQQLKYCKNCQNRKLDLQQGLVCNITGKLADFELVCENFVADNEALIANANKVIEEAGSDHLGLYGKRNMLFGALLFAGGTIVTVLSYQSASHGGRYVVAWGAIAFGLVQFIKGAIQQSSKM
jgi:hypothetical protein